MTYKIPLKKQPSGALSTTSPGCPRIEPRTHHSYHVPSLDQPRGIFDRRYLVALIASSIVVRQALPRQRLHHKWSSHRCPFPFIRHSLPGDVGAWLYLTFSLGIECLVLTLQAIQGWRRDFFPIEPGGRLRRRSPRGPSGRHISTWCICM